MRARLWISVLALGLLLVGILYYWPLSACAVALLALSRRYILAICAGLIADIAYGPPPAHLHWLSMPFTLFALALSAIWIAVSRHLRRQGRGVWL
jgi:hypothetical protein